jgi:putative transposase
VRQDQVIRSQAVRIAIGINDEGRRHILAVDLANRERQISWRDVLLELKSWGLNWVEFMLSDDHPGLSAIAEVIPEAVWQCC